MKKYTKAQELAIACELSAESGYCPSEDEYKDLKKTYGNFPKSILEQYSGNRTDEIVNMLVKEVLRGL